MEKIASQSAFFQSTLSISPSVSKGSGRLSLFGNRNQSDKWHKAIETSYASPLQTDCKSLNDEVVSHLRFLTDLYIKGKKKITPAEVDTKLIALIRKEIRKDFAVAACAHRLTGHALRDTLKTELLDVSGFVYGTAPYLRAIIIAHLINGDAVTPIECRLAQVLLPYFINHDSTNSDLQGILNIVLSGVTSSSLVYNIVESLASTIAFKFVTELNHLASTQQWSQAQKRTLFLSDLALRSAALSPDSLQPSQILQRTFSTWTAWACWQPSPARLNLAEKVSQEDRERFSDFLVLDGPDVALKCAPTLGDGLAASNTNLLSWGSAKVKLHTGMSSEARYVLDRLMKATEKAFEGNSGDRDLLAYMFIGRTIELDGLSFWEKVTATTDRSTSAKIVQFFKVFAERRSSAGSQLSIQQTSKESLDSQRDATQNLFFAFRNPENSGVQAALAPFLAHRAESVLQKMQERLIYQFERRMLSTFIGQLQAYGEMLKKDDWVFVFFNQGSALLLHSWPGQEKTCELERLRTAALTQLSSGDKDFVEAVEAYILNDLVTPGFIDKQTNNIVTSMLELWRRPHMSHDELALSIMLCQDSGPAWSLRLKCISQISSLSVSFVSVLRMSLTRNAKNPDQNCIAFTQALYVVFKEEDMVSNWRPWLTKLLMSRSSTLIDYSLETLGPAQWFTWIERLYMLYEDIIVTNRGALPSILQPEFHDWILCLSAVSEIIEELWRTEELKGLAKSILISYNVADILAHLVRVITSLQKAIKRYPNEPQRSMVIRAVSQLAEDKSNAEKVADAVEFMADANSEGMEACKRITDMHDYNRETTADEDGGAKKGLTADIMFGAVLHSSGLNDKEKSQLKAYGELLGLQEVSDDTAISQGLDSAADHLEAEIAALLADGKELELLRLGLQAKSPTKVTELLLALKIECPSRLDDELVHLPSDCIDLIEQVGSSEVELHFPLASVTPLQRIALGIGSAQNLTVRLEYEDNAVSGFCIHLDDEPIRTRKSKAHKYLEVVPENGDELHNPTCDARATRISYQLARILFQNLQEEPSTLGELHKFITTSIPQLGQRCIICGTGGVSLQRSTICTRSSCMSLWQNAHYNLLLDDLRQDPDVVDLLLTMVHVAAKSGKAELLPNAIVEDKDSSKILQLLAKLPPILDLKNDPDVYSTLRRRLPSNDPEVIDFLIRILNTYRGFLVSATGKLRIPSLPNVHQFLLANTSPESESTYTTHLGSQTPSVFFHGTSPDRLLSILHQGLQNLSGTGLQKHGATHGKGVYVAVEPSTSMGYATAIPASAGIGWRHSAYTNCQPLLGVEHAGPSTAKSAGIHVIGDPGKLVVRYFFMMPSATAPVSQHVVPAMSSVFAGLRGGNL